MAHKIIVTFIGYFVPSAIKQILKRKAMSSSMPHRRERAGDSAKLTYTANPRAKTGAQELTIRALVRNHQATC